MTDCQITGCSWIELKAGSYTLRANSSHMKNTSLCQIEVDVSYQKLVSHQPEGEWSKIAPFRILSFDIECAGRKGMNIQNNYNKIFSN